MTPHIRSVIVSAVRANDAEAVLDVRVELDGPGEVRGKLVGPRRPGAATVEVAYPLRPVGASDDAVTLRAVVPEPTLGTAADPVRYDGAVELWHAGARVEKRAISVEFRGG